MGKLRWYKRDPDAALGGMIGLSLEERGAYNTVLDLIYSHDDQLADDDRFIAGWCQCDVRAWRRVKASLVEKKKLTASGGLLRNFRATSEVFHGLRRIDQARYAGGIGGRKSHATRNNNNNLDEATAQATAQANRKRPLNTPTPTPTPTPMNHESSGAAAVSVAARAKAAAPLPDEKMLGEKEKMPGEKIDQIGEAACQAAGLDAGRLAIDFAVVGRWLQAGYDAEREILPAIRGVAARANYQPPRSGLNYFTGPIADFRAMLQAPMPKGETRSSSNGSQRYWWEDDGPDEGTPEWWDARVGFWLRYRDRKPEQRPWDGHWGPQPDRPRCRAPVEILAKHGLKA